MARRRRSCVAAEPAHLAQARLRIGLAQARVCTEYTAAEPVRIPSSHEALLATSSSYKI